MNDLARAAWSDLLFLANLILKWWTEMISDMCLDLDAEGCDFVTSETLDVGILVAKYWPQTCVYVDWCGCGYLKLRMRVGGEMLDSNTKDFFRWEGRWPACQPWPPAPSIRRCRPTPSPSQFISLSKLLK